MSSIEEKSIQENKFSTFGGVFTPSILTILGVIMFMRADFVIGQAGIINTLIILIIAKSITTLTTFSISAITTNMEVKGGGAYYLISRTLGPEFGGTIGLTLFGAQVLSIPFYIIGFTEALSQSFPVLSPFAVPISFITAIVIFAVTFRGASNAIKVQYFILAVLIISILSFLLGGLLHFDMETFNANLKPYDSPKALPFWSLFAIYFPAVTGIMAGVNMSGDLKDPSRSIPKGTFLAIAVGALIYALQTIIIGGAVGRDELINAPYHSLLNLAVWGISLFVTLGVFAATLSSALGSFVGSPRIIAALAVDKILAPLKPFAKFSKDGEPRRAIILSFIITLLVLVWAAIAGGDALNIVASLVSMFFLWTYGIINVAAFVESLGKNPSFRPRFKLFHWSIALLGAIGCLGAAILIDVKAALGALVAITGIYYYVKRTVLETSFGDARRGFYYSRIRQNLQLLANTQNHPKNWRPTILLYDKEPKVGMLVTQFSKWITGNRGIVILSQIVQGKIEEERDKYLELREKLSKVCEEEGDSVFSQLLFAVNYKEGVDDLIQTVGIGSIRPNLIMTHWTGYENTKTTSFYLRKIALFNKSIVLLTSPNNWRLPNIKEEKSIDIWWKGWGNGSLIAILAWMLASSREWPRTSIRFLRQVGSSEERIESEKEITELIHNARIDAEIKVIIETSLSFVDVIHRESLDATTVFMGFSVPNSSEEEERFGKMIKNISEDMPPILWVNSCGDADLFA